MTGDTDPKEAGLATGRSYGTGRTEGVSDAVFAVSLTLLILDVKPPEGDAAELVHGLVKLAPKLLTFALSFSIVAYYWLVHHLIFASMRGVKIGLIWANLLFLAMIVVLPFSTAVLGRYPLEPAALAVYGANLAACTLTLAGTWFVADRMDLIEHLAGQRHYILRRFAFQSLFALGGIACSFVVPALGLAIFVAFPIFYALTYRRTYY